MCAYLCECVCLSVCVCTCACAPCAKQRLFVAEVKGVLCEGPCVSVVQRQNWSTSETQTNNVFVSTSFYFPCYHGVHGVFSLSFSPPSFAIPYLLEIILASLVPNL